LRVDPPKTKLLETLSLVDVVFFEHATNISRGINRKRFFIISTLK